MRITQAGYFTDDEQKAFVFPLMPSVSVVVPNFNREHMLRQTLENLLAQSLAPHEIIVVDDGSTDGSVEVIRSFGEKVTLLKQANQGPGAARNAGLDMATGQYVQFQDSDDLLSLNKLEAQARLLEETEADIAYSPWVHVAIREWKVEFEGCVIQQSLPPKRIGLSAWMLRGWTTLFQSMLFRRTLFSSVGRYRTDVRCGEDLEFLFRMLSFSPRTAFTADALTLYRLDSPHKLSHDSGLAKSRRELDWARCLHCMIDWSRARRIETDFLTRCIFMSRVRKHLRYLRTAPEVPVALLRSLDEETRKIPAFVLGAAELWERVMERGRLFRRGYRWMPGYQASRAIPYQITLMNDLGFEVCQTPQ